MKSILPGRPQTTRQALCTVNWDGLRVVAYISGNSVIVFNGRREILQSIFVDDAAALYSLTIDERFGHIAVADADTVYLYQPFGRDFGDLRWTRAGTLPHETEEAIKYLSWGAEDELLVAGDRLTLWSLSDDNKPQVIWASNLSSPVSIAPFSPDAGLIASCGQHDRLVKIWRRLSYEQDSTRFDVSYLLHPSAVTNVSWRSFWHQEQNLDNLLYTFCADNCVRVWAHSEQHAANTMQQVISIDTNVSIQPRRLSVGSMSKNRFVFMLESRDLARAAERTIQSYRNGTDHALENFIQIVNRSPEVCAILDGLGHMSAWGIENAGLRNKQEPEKFNVALIDGVDISLPQQRSLDDHVQIHAFANNDVSASLCVLVHSYSGQIDWYQGSFVSFFDTSARKQRTQLLSCWSGHDAAIERLVSGEDHRSFVSVDEREHAILWSISPAGALQRKSRLQSDEAILDVVLSKRGTLAVILHEESISAWDLRRTIARKIGQRKFDREGPLSIHQASVSHENPRDVEVVVLYENSTTEKYGVVLPSTNTPRTNGYREPIQQYSTTKVLDTGNDDTVVFCSEPSATENGKDIVSLSDAGILKVFESQRSQPSQSTKPSSIFNTNIRTSNVVASSNGKIHALAHVDYQTVSIWDSLQGVSEFTQTFDGLDLIQELYWHTVSDGSLLLAVQFPYSVVIIGQKRYALEKSESAWEIVQIVNVRNHTTIPVNSLCWLQPAQLALGAGSQILNFDVELDQTTSNPSAVDGGNGPEEPRISERISTRHATLPLFDPRVLVSLLECTDLSVTSDIFRALHEELKFSVQDEAIDPNLYKSFDAVGIENLANLVENQSSDLDQIPDLTDILPQLEVNVFKISGTQLSPSQKRRLRTTLRIYAQMMEHRESMDFHAQTYLCHFLLALSVLNPGNPELPQLSLAAIVHASLSSTQESLTYFVLSQLEKHDVKFTWSNARALGIFLFTSDKEALRNHLEAVAKAEYNRSPDDRNPVDCSLYYLALDKKAVLQALWRRTVGIKEKENTLKLLARDFKDPKARATALKNAYALLSKRRFEYAAAFFLLGGSLSDAVNVCVNQLNDIQLAIAITRAWSGDASTPTMKRLIEQDMIEAAVNSHEARWLGVWGCVYQKDYKGALRFLSKPIDQLLEPQFVARRKAESEAEKKKNLPFAAYDYRVNQPGLLATMYLHLRGQLVSLQQWTREVALDIDERQFVMRCAGWYSRAGMDILALRLVMNWQFSDWQEIQKAKIESTKQATPTEQRQPSLFDEWLPSETGGGAHQDRGDKGKVDAVADKPKAKPAPTQFIEPSADSLLDSFGF